MKTASVLAAISVLAGSAVGVIDEAALRAEIDSLRAAQAILTQEIPLIQQRVDSVQHLVDSLQIVLVVSVVHHPVTHVASVHLACRGRLRLEPSFTSEATVEIPKGGEVQVLNYDQGFFHVV